MTDAQLLDQYARSGSQDAFAQLVARHADWIYSAALRMVRDGHLAEDVTQAVFLVLARDSRKLARRGSINGWLLKVTRYSSLHALRSRARRQRHEKKAAAMISEVSQPGVDELWEQLASQLDESVERLRRQDREAILLRFFQRKSMAEVGAALGVSEDAAKKRVAKAVATLRSSFAKNVATSSDALGAALLAKATHAAPVLLSGRCVPTSGGATASSAIAQGALKMLFNSQLKWAMSIVLSMMLIPLGIGVYLHAARAGAPPLAAAPRGAAPVAPPSEPSLIDLQGTWVYLSAEVSGKPTNLGADPTKVIIKGNEAHILSNGLDTVQMLLLDGSHDPGWFDATTTSGRRTQTILGIYSITGDQLRICSSNIGGPRPGDFTTQAGDARRLATLKRVSGSTTLPAGPALRLADMQNLRSIGMAIFQYSEAHKGMCPPDFGTLLHWGLKPDVFVSAEVGTQVPSGMNLRQLAHWVTDNSDYVYAGANMNLAKVQSTTTAVLAYDKDSNRGGKTINILFADGHLQVYDYVHAHQLIDEITKDQGL